MQNNQIPGKITLQENIEIIEKNRIPKTFVVHVPNPLKSYYSRFTEIDKPNSVVFVTKGAVSKEKIIRATKSINSLRDAKLDAAKARFNIGNKTYHGVRLKGINRFNHIEAIQREYQAQGFDFERGGKYKGEVDALLRISRFFDIEKIDEDIYKSKTMENTFYMVIPKPMNWDQFREVTFDIKNNISSPYYDVVKGIFYSQDEVVDFIRVMKPAISDVQLKEIKDRYWKKLERLEALNSMIWSNLYSA